MRQRITRHTELEVYQKAFAVAMEIFELTKTFPKEETYSMTDQIRRSSRSVCTNLAEAWRKRRYENHFVSKLSDADMEAGETQSWLEFSLACHYLSQKQVTELNEKYEVVIKMLVTMMNNPKAWLV